MNAQLVAAPAMPATRVRTPAAKAIRAHLRKRRPLFPPTLRIALGAGLALVGVYVVLLGYFWVNDRALFEDMIRLYVLTVLAGREPAMFAVYQPPTPVPLGWMLIIAVLDDVATLLLTISWVWVAFQRLRRARWIQGWIVGFEKTALEHRRWMRRWGLWGLAAFYWLPGFGSGVLAICVLGVAARIPLAKLVPVLVASASSVALFWAFALHQTSGILPSGPSEWLPAAVLIVVIVLAIASNIRQRQYAHILLLEWPPPSGEQGMQLEPFGIRPRGGIVEVDSRILADRLGLPDMSRGKAHAVAELLLIPGMRPEQALALRARGVGGVLDLSLLTPALVNAALTEEGVADDGVEGWLREARSMARGAGDAWRRHADDD